MYSIALRFAEKFAPQEGTIEAHKKIIEEKGFVWYGKLGTSVSDNNIHLIMEEKNPRILLIHSGSTKRYWAYIKDIKKERPDYSEFPDYYHETSDRFHTWFKVISIVEAPRNVMSQCNVASSGQVLSLASKHSMSPYFFIRVQEE